MGNLVIEQKQNCKVYDLGRLVVGRLPHMQENSVRSQVGTEPSKQVVSNRCECHVSFWDDHYKELVHVTVGVAH